jgi:hypothetical protein
MVNGDPGVRRLCEDRIILLRAADAKSALAKAQARGRASRYHYRNPSGSPVFFEFIGVTDLLKLGTECEADEVWYDILQKVRPMERRRELIRPRRGGAPLRGNGPTNRWSGRAKPAGQRRVVSRTMTNTWIGAVGSAGACLGLAILWHVSASHIVDDYSAPRSVTKTACLVADTVLFLVASLRLTAVRRGLGIFRGALWAAGAVAAGGLCVALFEGWRTNWGALCNQCDPTFSVPALPLLGGVPALIAAVAVGWIQRATQAALR